MPRFVRFLLRYNRFLFSCDRFVLRYVRFLLRYVRFVFGHVRFVFGSFVFFFEHDFPLVFVLVLFCDLRIDVAARLGFVCGYEFRLLALVDYRHNHAVHDDVQHPTYRPTQIQHFGRIDRSARGVNPHDTEHAYAEEVGNHRRERVTHTAHTANKHLDDTANEVYGQNDFHSRASVADNFGVGRVEPCDILPCREQNERPQKAYHDNHYRRFEHGFFDTFGFFRAVVLSHERNRCVRYGVHRRVHEAFEVTARRTARDKRITESVEVCLNQHVCDREKRVEYAAGQTDFEYLQKFVLVEAQFFKHEFAITFFFQEGYNEHNAGQILAYDSRNGNALDVEFCHDNEYKVERDVDDTGNREVYERTFRIAFCAKNGRAEIVQHVCGRADKIDKQIVRSLVQNRGVGFHPNEEISCAKNADKPNDRTAYERQKHRRMHGVLRALFVTRAYRLTHNDVRADGQAYDDVDYEVNKRDV